MLRAILLTAILPSALALAGCQTLSTSSVSISNSAVGVSNSISGSLESVSRSSAKGGGESARWDYREDVRLATRSFLTSGEGEATFLRELGSIAERHGISHWEGRTETLVGIGWGARQGGLSEAELDELLVRLGQAGAGERALAREGWRSAAL